jgi:hypothetical protein
VVGAKPPFAYKRAKTAPATAIPMAASRRCALCSPFTLIQAKPATVTTVFGGLNRLLAAALVAGALLAAPSSALASCGGGPSAENVYKECVPTGGGGKPTSGGSQTPASTSVSRQTALALKHAGKDRRVLASLVRGYGIKRLLGEGATSGAATSPSTLGSVFDLGSGPTALLIVLAGTAVLLLGGSGLRLWRRSHRA